MNLVPVNSNDRNIIYQIEPTDYIVNELANMQPQSILNTLTFIYANFSTKLNQYSSYLYETMNGIQLMLDDADSNIDELENQEDVVDIVATYYDLQQYDTTTLMSGDVIKVLADINYDNAPSFYEWNGSSFTFLNYEVDFPHAIISSSITINPTNDFTYIVSVNSITVTLGTNNIPDGIAIHITTLSNVTCTINYGNNTITLYANMGCDFIYYNGNWYTDINNHNYEQHRAGDIIISNNSSCPFSYGTWELLEEGCALVTGDSNNVTGEATGSNSVTFTPSYTATSGSTTIIVAMLPQHRHIVYVSAASASHSHYYGLTTVSCVGPKYSSEYGVNTTKGVTSSSVNSGNHQHTITAYMGLSSVYSSSPTGHTHTISNVADVTISTMQSSIAYYAWKRVA